MITLALAGCGDDDAGGGQTDKRRAAANPADIALSSGYRIELVASGFDFPTGVAFDDDGRPYVVEAGYSYGEVFGEPRLLRVEEDGSTSEVATGAHPPWTGVTFSNGALYVAAGGEVGGGQILRVVPGEEPDAIVTGLPSLGDHHTNGPVFDEQGSLYFTIGTATNSGVVGEDNFAYGWLERHPEFHDIPCESVTLAGENFESGNPLSAEQPRARTGAYVPFGTETASGQVIEGAVPCSGAVLRVPAEELARISAGDGAEANLELFAWGFRNPFGLAFYDTALYVTENGFDERGSRPVFGAGDALWRVEQGLWYGWPDYSAGRPVADARFEGASPAPKSLLVDMPSPPAPAAVLAVHSASSGFDFSRNGEFGHVGQAFIAQLGDMAPVVGEARGPIGFKVVRVDVDTGVVQDFAVNRGEINGPGSFLGTGGLERPVAARFDPTGAALYVVDFGVIRMSAKGAMPERGTGMLWKVTRGQP